MRSTPGSSFGPMAISATTAMTTSSLQPISNIVSQTPRGASRFGLRPRNSDTDADEAPRSGFELALGLGVLLERIGRLRLGDDLRIDRRVCLGGFVVGHAFLEGFDALGNVAHQLGNLAASEQQQDHGDHHDPVPYTQRTHRKTLRTERRTAALSVWPEPTSKGRQKQEQLGRPAQAAASWLSRSNHGNFAEPAREFLTSLAAVSVPHRAPRSSLPGLTRQSMMSVCKCTL